LPDWGLTSNVFFKKLWNKSRQYHPGKKPKQSSYTDAATGKTGPISFLSINWIELI
jgi:hypothetical protein